jgi:hypothetical protein
MMRTRTIAATVLAAVAGAAAVPALTGAQTTGAKELTLRMKVRAGEEVRHGGGRALATGDALVIRLAVFDAAGAPVGSAFTNCTNVGPRARAERAKLQCTQTYDLRDGQIVTAGVMSFAAADDLSIPIVGGSGAYRGARGELTTGAPVEGFDSVDVLHIDG